MIISDIDLLARLRNRVYTAAAVEEGRTLVSIRRVGREIVLGYDGGGRVSVSTGFGDHGLTMFVRADTGRVVAFGQITSDAAYDMLLPVHSPSHMLEMGLVCVQHVDKLDVHALALCARPVVDAREIANMVRAAKDGPRGAAYVHPAHRQPVDRAATVSRAAAAFGNALR